MLRTIFITLPLLANRLQSNYFRSTWLYFSFLFYLIKAKLRKGSYEKKIKICLNGVQRYFYLTNAIDIVALREVFVDGEYDLTVSKKPKVILDLGAHIGDTALFYNDIFPEAKIFAVEAMPNTYEKLKKNVEGIANIIPLHLAVTAESGQIEFYENASSLGNSVHKREANSDSCVVDAVSLTDLKKQIGCEEIDLVKFDIEGAEADLFDRIDTSKYAANYIGEVHLDLGVSSLENFSEKFPKKILNFSEISKNRRYLFTAVSEN